MKIEPTGKRYGLQYPIVNVTRESTEEEMVLLTIQQYQELQSQCEATESRAKQTVNENSNLKIEIKRLNHLVDTLKSLEQVLRDLKSL